MKTYLVTLIIDDRKITAGYVKAKTPDAAIRKAMRYTIDAGVTGIIVTEKEVPNE